MDKRAPKVEFLKDGDHMGIRTTATTYEQFHDALAAHLAELIDSARFIGDWEFQLGHWLPQIFEIGARLRGYKADVHEERVLYAGDPFIADAHIVRPEMSPTDVAYASAVAYKVDLDLRREAEARRDAGIKAAVEAAHDEATT
jgi:hypothetical protein